MQHCSLGRFTEALGRNIGREYAKGIHQTLAKTTYVYCCPYCVYLHLLATLILYLSVRKIYPFPSPHFFLNHHIVISFFCICKSLRYTSDIPHVKEMSNAAFVITKIAHGVKHQRMGNMQTILHEGDPKHCICHHSKWSRPHF